MMAVVKIRYIAFQAIEADTSIKQLNQALLVQELPY